MNKRTINKKVDILSAITPKPMRALNKRADTMAVTIMALLIVGLFGYTLFTFLKAKSKTDSLAINVYGTQPLYSQEEEIESHLQSIAKTATLLAYAQIMEQPAPDDPALQAQFKQAYLEYLKKGIQSSALQQKIPQDSLTLESISLSDTILTTTFKGITFTSIAKEKQVLETFRGVYSPDIIITIDLEKIGLTKITLSEVFK